LLLISPAVIYLGLPEALSIPGKLGLLYMGLFPKFFNHMTNQELNLLHFTILFKSLQAFFDLLPLNHLLAKTVETNSLSKSFNMAGCRV
ncbi:hypothetical protein P6709_19990, partial [Jeotgalibacillus sp. ET6]|uniref:hypothetical protein n=1 Tax=Jeotgalibacillus sp. ET6 TaxID=3037260 RepID=UPI0024181F2D